MKKSSQVKVDDSNIGRWKMEGLCGEVLQLSNKNLNQPKLLWRKSPRV